MNYIQLIPPELIELIIPFLDNDNLSNFLICYNIIDKVNWTMIYFLHFNAIKNTKYEEYFNWLSIDNLKYKLGLKETVEEIYDFKTLTLPINRMAEIPKEIENLINLEFLYLVNNKITEIPETVGKLINLKGLYLHNNKIEIISETVGNLNILKYLDLSYNKIEIISETVGKLINLQILYLSDNKIIKLPPELERFKYSLIIL